MNIKEAKEQVANTVRAYFARDEYGNFRIPPEEQRPVFLVGPPGIGKTAIMQQIAEEMNVGFVSYSMTHHTRQSALGLPLITRREYQGEAYDVTEYTMSEIIASVYEMTEITGCQNGILFLDEINCVSETLVPVMLQFLQYKTFGKHAVPRGWTVVTAGNPPEYNRSVREFDVVTWDRLKRIDVEPDFTVWKEYALKRGIHPAVLTYLDAKKDCFYKVESDVDGPRFVTARGWADLSSMIALSEEIGLPVDKKLVAQYLQDPEIAEDFAVYYDIFNKYKSDYQIGSILAGEVPEDIRQRAADAPFDEKLSLIGLLLDAVGIPMREAVEKEDAVSLLLADLRRVKAGESVTALLAEEQEKLSREERRGLSREKRKQYDSVIAFLKSHAEESFDEIKADYDRTVRNLKASAQSAKASLENLFSFAESAWGSGQELLILVTELTVSHYAARFISRYGSEAYYRHSEELMFYERNVEIIRQLEQLEENDLS